MQTRYWFAWGLKHEVQRWLVNGSRPKINVAGLGVYETDFDNLLRSGISVSRPLSGTLRTVGFADLGDRQGRHGTGRSRSAGDRYANRYGSHAYGRHWRQRGIFAAESAHRSIPDGGEERGLCHLRANRNRVAGRHFSHD